MKKSIRIIGILACMTLLFSSCARMPNKREEAGKFSFALVWNCYGVSSYDSKTGRLVKTTDATHPEDYVTKLRLSEEDLNKIYSLIRNLNPQSYPDNYKPCRGESIPYSTIALTVRYRDTEKTIYCEKVSGSKDGKNMKAQKFLDTCDKIIGILTASEEWCSLPEYEFFYD